MNQLLAITLFSVCGAVVSNASVSNHTADFAAAAASISSQPSILSRQRRFLSFPKGSTFSCVVCMTVGFHGNPQYDFISWAVNWGVAYELPNSTWVNHNLNAVELPRSIVQRRFRRDFYRNIEQTIDTMGWNGRQCVLRALCEGGQYLRKTAGSNMVLELLRIVFSIPRLTRLPFEHPEVAEYDHAHRKGRRLYNCEEAFPECGFSLIELALGRYSAP